MAEGVLRAYGYVNKELLASRLRISPRYAWDLMKVLAVEVEDVEWRGNELWLKAVSEREREKPLEEYVEGGERKEFIEP